MARNLLKHAENYFLNLVTINKLRMATNTQTQMFSAHSGENKYQFRTYYINIDSNDRDRTIWSDSGNFEVRFDPGPGYKGASIPRSLKNVYSVELVDAVYPNVPGVANNMYLLICCPELSDGIGMMDSTNNGTSKILAKLLPANILGSFVQTLYNDPEITKIVFPTEGKRIDKMTIEFRTNTGAILQFCGTNGSADPASAPIATLQTSITLRIVIRDRIIG
jgi:hypothetical protein